MMAESITYNLISGGTIGVISDTHGLMRFEALAALVGVDLILHAGDIGNLQIIEQLKKISPVIAVRGNNDKGKWADDLPFTATIKTSNLNIYMLHDLKEIEVKPDEGDFQVIISGHTHRPCVEKRDTILYLNPGSAGPRRFKLPVTVACLKTSDKNAEAEIIDLRLDS
jgi:putative phosphoesterase